ncbi:g9505 [Coccomyxa elongata]
MDVGLAGTANRPAAARLHASTVLDNRLLTPLARDLRRGSSCQRRQEKQQAVCSTAGAVAAPFDDAGASPGSRGMSRLADTLASIKGFIFYTTTFLLALPLFAIMLLLSPFVALFDKHRRLAQHFVNNIWAKISTFPYYGVEIIGKENLPAADTPAVYVANHQSFLDIFTLFHLDRPFKFVSKTSNFFIPIVGWSMFLTGHIKLNRVDKRSQIKCLGDCKDLLAKGASVLFFPEGTRSKDGKMAEFKKGAFSVASKAKVPIVPVTLLGTGHLMPNGQEGRMYNGRVKMIVHPPIGPGNPDDTMEEARRQIASGLPAWAVA